MRKDHKHNTRVRIIVIGVGFALVLAVLTARAFDLQIRQHEELSANAQKEFMRKIEVPPRRGIIFDRNLEELAVSLDTDSIGVRPAKISDLRTVSASLAAALQEDPRLLLQRLQSAKSSYVWVARKVSPDKANAVRALNLEGIDLTNEPKRFYPHSELACHILGFAGIDANGLEGLEKRYDSELKGSARTTAGMKDALGRVIHLQPKDYAAIPEGENLVLTIDKNLQYQVEKILAATVAKYKAVSGQAIVMASSSGEIWAMASVPAFDPNNFSQYPPEFYRNRVVADVFEPGSTFKIFVAAAALNQGRIPLKQTFFCENGQWQIAGRLIHDTHPHGNLTMSEIIKYSSNIGAAKLGQMVGAEDLNKTIRAFGFGRPVGIDLPAESSGMLRKLSPNRLVDLANLCFGQGVAVTGIQLITAVNAVANGGVLLKPHLLKAVIDRNAQLLKEIAPEQITRVMEPEAAAILTDMMTGVTQSGGTAAHIKVGNTRIAGKSGTAQKAIAGGYSNDDYIASFVGFLPAENPQLTIMVQIDSPRGRHFGSVVAGPAWVDIAKAGLQAIGYVQPQSASLKPGQRQAAMPYLAPDPEPQLAKGLMPDLRGLSLRQALELAGRQGVEISASGFGRVISQQPGAGEALSSHPWIIKLAPAEGGV
jgi:cell division protein FtsI (penicillin-binding protein 3)